MEKKIIDEIQHLKMLLKKEKETDLQQYNEKIESTSLHERKKKGVCWYPIELDRSSYDIGERLIVKVSINKDHLSPHGFQSGKSINLFTNAQNNTDEHPPVKGIVNNVRGNEMMITLMCDQLPYWISDGMLGIQLMFDENSYKEMEKGLKELLSTENERTHELVSIILGGQSARFTDQKAVQFSELNASQNDALNNVIKAKDIAIIHGPPGTGKTTTLVYSIVETLRLETQVLVCAPSNAAADLLVEKLGERQVSVLRVGNPARITKEVLDKTLDVKITEHSNYKTLKSLRKHAEEYRAMGRKYKRNFGNAERMQRKMLLQEARKLKDEAESILDYIISDIFTSTRVLVSTLVGANNRHLKRMHFDTVFIDEAAQGLEPASWIPILKSNRVIFAGDHKQLPPTIKSYEAAKQGLEITLFEKAIHRNVVDVLLKEQYRMNETIMRFSGKQFYKDQLIANADVAQWHIFKEDKALEYIDTAGCGFFENQDQETRSTKNLEEAQLLFTHLKQYLSQLTDLGKHDELSSIGIISPYRAQLEVLQQELKTAELDPETLKKININTIDSFQGQERDVIYISLVRANEKGEIGFLSDTRRMNVAMTRARKKLVVIGDSSTITQHKFYSDFLDYVNEVDAYRSGFEFMY